MSRTALVAAAAAGAAALAAVAVWLVLVRDTAEPASVAEAVTGFREGQGETPGGRAPVPVGVYLYETRGQERTDALTGVTHRYPAQSTITVTRDPCGIRMRWDVLEGRSTTWTFCLREHGWTLESQEERHTFFGRTEPTTYRCTGVLFRPEGDVSGVMQRGSCAAGETAERTAMLVVGRTSLAVEGVAVETVHVRRTSAFSGETRGESAHDVWLDRASGVPVRVRMRSRTTNDSPIGDVHYEEDVSLRLVSLVPRR